MSTYIPSSKDGSLKKPVGNNMMHMSHQPYVQVDIPKVGIPGSGVVSQQEFSESRIRGNEFGLLRDGRSHEMLLMEMGSDQYQNPNVGFPCLVVESTQQLGSNPYGIGNVFSDSKYVKATQQLLDEAVNVRKALKQKYYKQESMNDSHEVLGESNNQQDSSLLSAAEKQDLQNKMTKLSSMLNDVSLFIFTIFFTLYKNLKNSSRLFEI